MPEPKCLCGKTVDFYSALLEQGFCSDACYYAAMESARRGNPDFTEDITYKLQEEEPCTTSLNPK